MDYLIYNKSYLKQMKTFKLTWQINMVLMYVIKAEKYIREKTQGKLKCYWQQCNDDDKLNIYVM